MKMETPHSYPIDRVLFETTEFCENQCYFCYGSYGPEGEHMPPDRFSLYLRNLIEADLLDPRSLLILFGGEFLNHPQCLEICRAATELKKASMHLVIITSGKFREEFREQVETLIDRRGLFHHWEVSIKDVESFKFGLRLLDKGQDALFRYDYLNPTGLKKSIENFFLHVKSCGIWKAFKSSNPAFEKELRYARKNASSSPDTVIIQEFFYSGGSGNPRSVGLTFSPLDRSVMRKGETKTEAKCSLFHSQYQKAIHVTRDGDLYPCHLPRFKKKCEPLGNAADLGFLRRYRSRIQEFKDALSEWQEAQHTGRGICIEGCRGKFYLKS